LTPIKFTPKSVQQGFELMRKDGQTDRHGDATARIFEFLHCEPLKKIMLGKTLFVLWSVLRGKACKFSIEFWLKCRRLPLI